MTVQTYPTAPAVTGIKGTLLDAASVAPAGGYRMVAETDEMWQSFNCIRFDARTGAWCAAADPEKTFSSPEWSHGFRFDTYGGIECSLIGFDRDDAKAQAERVFEQGESAGVERALMRSRFVVGPVVGGEPTWDAPTDITPAGGAVHPAVGMALLEGFISDNYVGVPLLHLPRTIASLLASNDRIDTSGSTFYTKLGSKVAAGVGYDFPNTGPTGAVAAAGERWLYASGAAHIMLGETIVKEAVDEVNNTAYTLVERPYMAAVDCMVIAIRVTLSA